MFTTDPTKHDREEAVALTETERKSRVRAHKHTHTQQKDDKTKKNEELTKIRKKPTGQ